ncbi:MAG: aconitate hydratase AcnA [Candidatus Eremiobacteraeota bacterium]|nr:aconitate hydratase AcnA [Candidatus Eremiobacteraeota bacterium]
MVGSSRATLEVGGRRYRICPLPGSAARLPYALKVLLENLLRHGEDAGALQGPEIPYRPVRILAPDSSGLPLVADLATMREAMRALGADPRKVDPLVPVDLVVDHSLIVDVAGRSNAAEINLANELARNRERYAFVRWAQGAFERLRVIPPGNGILHQINLEVLAKVVWTQDEDGRTLACPDAMIGMDSHTPMVNALGVAGWGVGGIEAVAAMLGQPIPLAVPKVVGCRLRGRPQPGVTTTDVVLTLTQALRGHGVVGAFVEFTGEGADALGVPERATLANMAPEYGATMGFFPIDAQTLRYLRLTGRAPEHVALVEAYAKAQGLWRDADAPEPAFDRVVDFDLAAVEPSLAGPRRPQDRVSLANVPESFAQALASIPHKRKNGGAREHGDVVIAALTSCTNTSNPAVMVAAGLLARNAVARGLSAKPWVKTSLAPGSRAVGDYLDRAGLTPALDALGFGIVGYGCTTCMGNSGPLDAELSREIEERELVVTAVLSGNRNFEGRVHPLAKTSYLASPPLVVAYALAGSVTRDLTREPVGEDSSGEPVYLREIWPNDDEVQSVIDATLDRELFLQRYRDGLTGSPEWDALHAEQSGETYAWEARSNLIRKPPFLDGVRREPPPLEEIAGARPLLVLGDSVTTDHISPIGAIPKGTPAFEYLVACGEEPGRVGSYNLRRLNHDVMIRGTFANPRIRNEMVAGTEGGFTRCMPGGEVTSVYDCAMRYAREGTPAVVVAGAEYGTGSSRDWAARGTRLLGVRAVLAESFERIHRSNLVGMGVLPLEFEPGTTRKTLALDGSERFTIDGIRALHPRARVACTIERLDGSREAIQLLARIDTAVEFEWYRSGGILPHVLRLMLR